MGGSKVVFILSSTRSGSTWLGYVLGHQPGSAFLGEYHRGWENDLRVPCSWCHANNVEVCPVLGGFEAVPVDEAFEFAFSRTGAATLIDSSKRSYWAQRFLRLRDFYDIRLVHLMRDPRGWYASERRRRYELPTLSNLLHEWVEEQHRIRSFLRASQVPSATVFYDDLAAEPVTAFPPLCDVIDVPFNRDSLEYWDRVQHGFAANGASSFLLSSGPNGPNVFTTGDDRFYATNHRTLFTDARWESALTPREAAVIENDRAVADLLLSYGRVLRAQQSANASAFCEM